MARSVRSSHLLGDLPGVQCFRTGEIVGVIDMPIFGEGGGNRLG